MNVILTVYGSTAFKRFLLPSINDADYTLLLSKDLYGLEENLPLRMEIMEGEWRFALSDDYQLMLSDDTLLDCGVDSPSLGQLYNAGRSALRLLLNGVHLVSIIIRLTDRSFSAYQHYRLPEAGEIVIGRRSVNTICMNPPGESMVSGVHASLVYDGERWVVEDKGSKNGTFVNNRSVKSMPLSFGDCIDLFGLRIVYLGTEIAVNVFESGAVISDRLLIPVNPVAQPLDRPNKKRLDQTFHRSPRQLSRLDESTVKIDPAPAPKEDPRRISVLAAIGTGLAMALPMLLGCALMIYASSQQGMGRSAYMFVGLVTSVTSAIIGVFRSLSTMKKAQKEYEEYEVLRRDKYGQYLTEREQDVCARYLHNTEVLKDRHKAADVVCRYTANDAALWGKNVSQPDFLMHRIGLGSIPFQVNVEIPEDKFTLVENDLAIEPRQIKQKYQNLKGVPICIDFRECHLVGIIGGKRNEGGVQVARSVISQIAATNSYTEVKLVVVYDEERSGSVDLWSYVRWLPHVWNETRTLRYVASNREEAREVFFELNRIMRARIEERRDSLTKATPLPHYVLVLVAPHLLEGELFAQYVFDPRDEYGLTTLYLAERYEELPNECQFVVQNDHGFKGTYHVTDNVDERSIVCFDHIDLGQAERQAATLAKVRVLESQSGGDIPETVSFLDLYGVRRPEQLDVLKGWRKNRTYDSMRALIGLKSGGAPCYLDIHEKFHGPHGLVAGTTGSGKSETLQTFILSLAVNFSPDDVSFFIIDYKGGGMASLLSGLPHLIGEISNLSGNQVNRALVSIQSEKNRREAIFKEYGVKDIRDYTRLIKSGEATLPVPHLVIVIDEFAEMKQDEPEFIQEIVSLARVGRSLGIHLIMATQRPAGAVSEDIWANSRFKLCLRVQSRQDSSEMLHRPDAAFLTQTGRCYLQVGNDELFELFQSGYSGAPYSADGVDGTSDIATMLSVNGAPALVGSHARIQRQRERRRAWVETLLACLASCGIDDHSQLVGLSREQLQDVVEAMYTKLEEGQVDYPRTDHNTESLVVLCEQVARTGFDADRLLAAEESPLNKFRLPERPERTQLEAIVGYLSEVATANGYTRDYSLFLPLLPKSIALTDVNGEESVGTQSNGFDGSAWPGRPAMPTLAVGLGRYDDPLNQRQGSYVYDLLRDGTLIVYGGPQTGKSTFLQTLVFALLTTYDPSCLSLYAIEYSARKFGAFDEMPHMGGIVRDNDDVDRLDKLFTMLQRQVEERKQVLGDMSYSQYLALHGMGSLPATVIVIDNYASLAQGTNDSYAVLLRNLTKEGPGYGIYLIASAGGVGSGEVPNALAQNFRTVVCLELPNDYDYADYLRKSRLEIQPEMDVPGRGLAVIRERVLEFQTALPLADANELETGNYVRQLAQEMSRVWRGRRAQPIPFIPEEPTWEAFVALESTQRMLNDTELLPLGYDVQHAEPFGIDLMSTYTYCITGAKKKGKTNALRVLARSAKAKGSRVVLVDFGEQSARFAEQLGIEYIENEQEFFDFMMGLEPRVAERNVMKGELRDAGCSDKEIYLQMKQFERIVVLIDDLPQFVDRTYERIESLDYVTQLLLPVWKLCTLHNIYWFAAIDQSEIGSASTQELYKEFVKDHKGAHFGGKTYETAIAGFSFDKHELRTLDNLRPVGRAMLPSEDDTEVLEVVVPMA